MATDTTTPPNFRRHTTIRGMATASFSLGFWGLCTFWWYPLGISFAFVGVCLGLLTLALGVRAGRDGENLAILGVACGTISISLGIAIFRFMQMAFEGMIPRIFP